MEFALIQANLIDSGYCRKYIQNNRLSQLKSPIQNQDLPEGLVGIDKHQVVSMGQGRILCQL